MKKIFILLSIFGMMFAYAADEEKIYTEKDFSTKVDKTVNEKIEKIKSTSVTQLTREILDREQKLDEREKVLIKREEQLKIAEETLSKKIFSVETDQKKIIGCIDDHKAGQARRVKQMVSVIANMKPAKAAEVLSVQDSLISVKILDQIDPKRVSKIFNLMDKEVSARLQKQYLNMQK